MDNRIQLDRKQINAVRKYIQAAFPRYKGFKVTIVITDREQDCTSYWDSGNRDYFAAIHLASGQVKHVPQNGTPFDKITVPKWVPSSEQILIQHAMRGSGPDRITIYIHPSLAPKMIEQSPAVV